ncbi:MAG: hypothetical protein Q7J54_01525 [Candidatus Woesearchaeota archaeon]|nr:hypothetical protein [Candidatus Woesearchaeota archaeon]
MAKAEVQNLVFVFMLALLVIGLVMIFGFKAISDLMVKSTEADFIRFKTALERDIGAISTEAGSSELLDLKLPVGYNQMCFVDDDLIGSPSPPANLNPIIKNSISSGIQKNIFLIKSRASAESFYVGKINIPDPDPTDSANPLFLCTDTSSGRVAFRITGRGNYVEISES